MRILFPALRFMRLLKHLEHEEAAVSWRRLLIGIKKSKKKLLKNICPDCDMPVRDIYDCEKKMNVKTCSCTGPATDDVLVALLRRQAGIYGGSGEIYVDDFKDALRGKAGPRACGINSWDNAVRAIEEDR